MKTKWDYSNLQFVNSNMYNDADGVTLSTGRFWINSGLIHVGGDADISGDVILNNTSKITWDDHGSSANYSYLISTDDTNLILTFLQF